MLARAVDSIISTIISYSSNQDTYVKSYYIYDKTDDIKKSTETSSKEKSTETSSKEKSAEVSSKEKSAESTLKFDLEKNIVKILSSDQISIFENLINNLALEYLSEFAVKAKENIELGKKLNSVHILNTFEFFLSTDARKAKIQKIFAEKRTLKFTLPFRCIEEVSFEPIRAKSIKGFCDVLEKSHKDENLLTHLPFFVKKLNKDAKYAETLTSLITDGKYQEFFHKVLLEE